MQFTDDRLLGGAVDGEVWTCTQSPVWPEKINQGCAYVNNSSAMHQSLSFRNEWGEKKIYLIVAEYCHNETVEWSDLLPRCKSRSVSSREVEMQAELYKALVPHPNMLYSSGHLQVRWFLTAMGTEKVFQEPGKAWPILEKETKTLWLFSLVTEEWKCLLCICSALGGKIAS